MTIPGAIRKGCFVTATDTGVGKTFVAVRLIRAMRLDGLRVCGFKPICCGDRDDAILLVEAAERGCDIDVTNPVWIRHPVAPLAAELLGEPPVRLETVLDAFRQLSQQTDAVVVEGAGGWLVPVTRTLTMADVAVALGLPVVLVVPNRLGCINHALLTVQAIAATGLHLAGWILNTICFESDDPAQRTNRSVLEQLMPCPLLHEFGPPKAE